MDQVLRNLLLAASIYTLGGCTIIGLPPRNAEVAITKQPGCSGPAGIDVQSQQRTCFGVFSKDPEGLVCQTSSSWTGRRFVTWTSTDNFTLVFPANHPFVSISSGDCNVGVSDQRKQCELKRTRELLAAGDGFYKYDVDFGGGCARDPHLFLRR